MFNLKSETLNLPPPPTWEKVEADINSADSTDVIFSLSNNSNIEGEYTAQSSYWLNLNDLYIHFRCTIDNILFPISFFASCTYLKCFTGDDASESGADMESEEIFSTVQELHNIAHK